ncbi:MAG: phosphatase PAP2 family protein [Candidatus Saliniplasma sp.]
MKETSSEKLCKNRNFILALLFAVSFIILTGLVVHGSTDSIDVSILHFLVGHVEKLPISITIIFDYTDIPIYFTFFLGMIYFIKEKSYHQALTYLSTVTVSSLSYPLLKLIIARPRPTTYLVYRSGFAYPSGHATMSFAVFIGLYVSYYIYRKMEHDYLYFSILSTAAVIIAYSRIFMGYHHLTDIIAGYLLAATIVVLIPPLFQYPVIKKQSDKLGDFMEEHIVSRFRK